MANLKGIDGWPHSTRVSMPIISVTHKAAIGSRLLRGLEGVDLGLLILFFFSHASECRSRSPFFFLPSPPPSTTDTVPKGLAAGVLKGSGSKASKGPEELEMGAFYATKPTEAKKQSPQKRKWD